MTIFSILPTANLVKIIWYNKSWSFIVKKKTSLFPVTGRISVVIDKSVCGKSNVTEMPFVQSEARGGVVMRLPVQTVTLNQSKLHTKKTR